MYNIYNINSIITIYFLLYLLIHAYYSINTLPNFQKPNFRNSENHHAGMFGRVVTKVNEVKCQKWESGKVGNLELQILFKKFCSSDFFEYTKGTVPFVSSVNARNVGAFFLLASHSKEPCRLPTLFS